MAWYRKLGRPSEHRWAMLRNMVTQLIYHERIMTTTAKAKELRRGKVLLLHIKFMCLLLLLLLMYKVTTSMI